MVYINRDAFIIQMSGKKTFFYRTFMGILLLQGDVPY